MLTTVYNPSPKSEHAIQPHNSVVDAIIDIL